MTLHSWSTGLPAPTTVDETTGTAADCSSVRVRQTPAPPWSSRRRSARPRSGPVWHHRAFAAYITPKEETRPDRSKSTSSHPSNDPLDGRCGAIAADRLQRRIWRCLHRQPEYRRGLRSRSRNGSTPARTSDAAAAIVNGDMGPILGTLGDSSPARSVQRPAPPAAMGIGSLAYGRVRPGD